MLVCRRGGEEEEEHVRGTVFPFRGRTARHSRPRTLLLRCQLALLMRAIYMAFTWRIVREYSTPETSP